MCVPLVSELLAERGDSRSGFSKWIHARSFVAWDGFFSRRETPSRESRRIQKGVYKRGATLPLPGLPLARKTTPAQRVSEGTANQVGAPILTSLEMPQVASVSALELMV
jgi:hypothetical protein